jgi:hypothetical protein
VTEDQADLVARLLHAGADLVIGHSPHIAQAVEAMDGRLALFSLGNFIFRPDYRMPSLAYTSIVTQITFKKNVVYARILPILIDYNGIPSHDHGNETIRRIAQASQAFNTTLDITENVGQLSIDRNTSTECNGTGSTWIIQGTRGWHKACEWCGGSGRIYTSESASDLGRAGHAL